MQMYFLGGGGGSIKEQNSTQIILKEADQMCLKILKMLFLTVNYYLLKNISNIQTFLKMFTGCRINEQKATKIVFK